MISKTRNILAGILCFGLVCDIGASNAMSAPQDEESAEPVLIFQLLLFPERYLGKKVDVAGFLHFGTGVWRLYPYRDDAFSGNSNVSLKILDDGLYRALSEYKDGECEDVYVNVVAYFETRDDVRGLLLTNVESVVTAYNAKANAEPGVADVGPRGAIGCYGY